MSTQSPAVRTIIENISGVTGPERDSILSLKPAAEIEPAETEPAEIEGVETELAEIEPGEATLRNQGLSIEIQCKPN